MSWGYSKTQPVGVGRASLSAASEAVIKSPDVQDSNSAQLTAIDGHIDVSSAGGSDTRIHLTDKDDSTNLWTFTGEETGQKQLPRCPEVITTKPGNDLGLKVEGTACQVVASIVVGQEM